MHEGIPLPLIQRQLGHSHLSTTGTYLEGINHEEIIATVHAQASTHDARQRQPRPLAGIAGAQTRSRPQPLLSSQATASP